MVEDLGCRLVAPKQLLPPLENVIGTASTIGVVALFEQCRLL